MSQKHKKAYHVSACSKNQDFKARTLFWFKFGLQTTFFVKSLNDINKVKVPFQTFIML